MANKVTVQVLGGTSKTVSANTIGEVKEMLGLEKHTAMLNGEPASDSTILSDFSFVALAPAVKGG